MMIVKVYRNDVLEVEHELHQMSLNNGYMSVFMTGGLVSLGLAVGDLVNVQVYDGDGKVADVTATFESYQFSMSSYVSNGGDGSDDGSTQTGGDEQLPCFQGSEDGVGWCRYPVSSCRL